MTLSAHWLLMLVASRNSARLNETTEAANRRVARRPRTMRRCVDTSIGVGSFGLLARAGVRPHSQHFGPSSTSSTICPLQFMCRHRWIKGVCHRTRCNDSRPSFEWFTRNIPQIHLVQFDADRSPPYLDGDMSSTP